MYFHDRSLAEDYLAKRKTGGPPSQNDQIKNDQLTAFAENFREVVTCNLRAVPSAQSALSVSRHLLPPSLANEVRDLLRTRGASVHPVPEGRCNRVLANVKRYLEDKEGCHSSDPDMIETAADTNVQDAVKRYEGACCGESSTVVTEHPASESIDTSDDTYNDERKQSLAEYKDFSAQVNIGKVIGDVPVPGMQNEALFFPTTI